VGDGAAVEGEAFDVAVVEVHGVDADQVGAEQAEGFEPGDRALAEVAQAVLDLAGGFVDVDVDGEFELVGQGADALEGLVGDGVGAWGARAKRISGWSRQASKVASPLRR
jgi:hypothetical protein